MAGPAFRLERARGRVGWGGFGGGFERGGKTEKERKKRFMLCSTAVLFVALFPLCVWR